MIRVAQMRLRVVGKQVCFWYPALCVYSASIWERNVLSRCKHVRGALQSLWAEALPSCPDETPDRCRQGAAHIPRAHAWPQFTQIADALTVYLDEITDKVIREEVHCMAGEAEEVAARHCGLVPLDWATMVPHASAKHGHRR